MKTTEFCYWLQGYFEINEQGEDKKELNPDQVQCIKNHLSLVFHHDIDPKTNAQSNSSPEELQEIHDGIPSRPPANFNVPYSGKVRC